MQNASPVAPNLAAEIINPQGGERQHQKDDAKPNSTLAVALEIPTEPDMNWNHCPGDDQEGIGSDPVHNQR